MTIKRSYRHLFLGAVGVALVLSNCTVKEDNDDSCEKGDVHQCDCAGNVKGHQDCRADGTFGACECPSGAAGSGNTSGSSTGGSGDDEGGAPSAGTGGSGGTAGSSAGGANAEAGAGGTSEGGADGAGGEPAFMFADCDECVETLCATELEACQLADDDGLCIEQWAAISSCVQEDREKGNNVSRDRLRGCGVSVGASADPDLVGLWAPQGMTEETRNLINCLATSSSALPDDEWANASGSNYNPSIKPWPADSCAKLACTSPLAE